MNIFRAETLFRSGAAIFLPLHLSLATVDPDGLQKTCPAKTLIRLPVKPNLYLVSVKTAGYVNYINQTAPQSPGDTHIWK